ANLEDVPGLVAEIRDRRPSAHVVVASATSSWEHARAAFRAGAADYVLKSGRPDEMLATIEEIRGRYAPAEPLRDDGPEALMDKQTILCIDNDPDFLELRAENLEREGYRVLRADSAAAARAILQRETIDLA